MKPTVTFSNVTGNILLEVRDSKTDEIQIRRHFSTVSALVNFCADNDIQVDLSHCIN